MKKMESIRGEGKFKEGKTRGKERKEKLKKKKDEDIE